MANIKIREITERDFDAVMNIRRAEDFRDGLDYLQDYFTMIIRTPGYKGYAATADGKIVAFKFACLLDDDQTLFTRGGRVSKAYSGTGAMQTLIEYVLEKYRKIPTVLYYASTFNVEMYYNKIHSAVIDGRTKLVHEKAKFAYKASLRAMRNPLRELVVPHDVKEVLREDLSDLFSSPELCRQIFPDDRLVIDWVHYQPMTSNVPYIFTERCSVFGSIIDMMSNPEDRLLTFASFVVLNSVILYNFDVYGTNKKALSGHLIAHLKTLKSLPHDTLQLEFYCYDDFNRSHCDEAVKGLGFQHFNVFRKRQFCINTDLKTYMNKSGNADVANLKSKI